MKQIRMAIIVLIAWLSLATPITQAQAATKGIEIVTKKQIELQNLVQSAKDAGIPVTETDSKTVTTTPDKLSDDKQAIEDDYDQQISDLKDQIAKWKQYQTDLKAWEDYMKNPTIDSGTDWPHSDLLGILGSDPTDATYLNASSKMTFDKGNLAKLTAAQINSFNTSRGSLPAVTTDSVDTSTNLVAPIRVGSYWRYNSAFVEASSGTVVDVKVTVKQLSKQSGDNLTPIASIQKNKLNGSDLYAPVNATTYHLDFYKHGTDTPLTIKRAVLGVGDIDGKQYLKYSTTPAKSLIGAKVVHSGNQFAAYDDTAYSSNDPVAQAWVAFDDLSSLDYTYGYSKTVSTTKYSADYHVLGNIAFEVELKDRPAEPEPLSYQLTKLYEQPAVEKDVMKADDLDKSINGQTVANHDQLAYKLMVSPLPAERLNDTTKVVYTDKLPDGFSIDETATKTQLNSIYDLKIDGQTVTISVNANGLQMINQDKTKECQLPPIYLVGKVIKPDITLVNNFDWNYNDDIYTSNQVTNDTKLQALTLPNTGSYDQLVSILGVTGLIVIISITLYIKRKLE